MTYPTSYSPIPPLPPRTPQQPQRSTIGRVFKAAVSVIAVIIGGLLLLASLGILVISGFGQAFAMFLVSAGFLVPAGWWFICECKDMQRAKEQQLGFFGQSAAPAQCHWKVVAPVAVVAAIVGMALVEPAPDHEVVGTSVPIPATSTSVMTTTTSKQETTRRTSTSTTTTTKVTSEVVAPVSELVQACPEPPPEPETPEPPAPPVQPAQVQNLVGTQQNSAGAYPNCCAAWTAGDAPVYAGSPGYGPHLDRDHDGIGCEKRPKNC